MLVPHRALARVAGSACVDASDCSQAAFYLLSRGWVFSAAQAFNCSSCAEKPLLIGMICAQCGYIAFCVVLRHRQSCVIFDGSNRISSMRIWKHTAKSGLGVLLLLLAVLVSGCMQGTIEPASHANFTSRDRKLLAFPPYLPAAIPEQFQRQIVNFKRKEAPGTIVIDTGARYLYYVLPRGKAIRYGVAVGEEAHAWSGVARIGRMAEWPAWVPTAGEREAFHAPSRVAPGPANPMGARAMYLYEGNKDTLYRIHGTNQPEYIGQAVSTGCIRMTNENVIDLYGRVKTGTPVVVLASHKGNSPPNPQVVSGGNPLP